MVRKFTKTKILQIYLNDYDKAHYLEEIAQAMGTSHQTIKPYVEELVKENILEKKQRKKITDYVLNRDNPATYTNIAIAEQERTMEAIKKDRMLKTLYEKTAKHFDNATIIIFGSATENTEKANDIDILCVGDAKIEKTLQDFKEIYTKKTHLIKIISWKEISDTLIKEIKKKHIIFNNTEEAVRQFKKWTG